MSASAYGLVLGAILGITGCSSSPTSAAELVLVKETKFAQLLGGAADRYEASGVVARGASLFVAFDNMTRLGIVSQDLSEASLTDGKDSSSNYEGITVDDYGTEHFYVIEEMDEQRGRVAVFDATPTFVKDEWTDVAFAGHWGFEGVAWFRRDDRDYLLALCQGNSCTDDSQHTGNGRIQVLLQTDETWQSTATLSIPSKADFEDYSDIALRNRADGTAALAVVSHRSSALWLGELAFDPLRITGPGEVYHFPRVGGVTPAYCTIEGVSFLSETTFAVVSDRAEAGEDCVGKDQSVHLFALP